VIAKEFRALLPVWTACAVAVVASGRSDTWLAVMAVPSYFIGAAALGGLAFGHEYTLRTLSMLLSQPVPRWRIFATKAGVLALLLVALRGVLLLVPLKGVDTPFAQAAMWLPVLAGLCVAPWLTLLCRSPIAGAVFTLSIAGIFLIAGELLGILRYGYTSQVDDVRVAFIWRAMAAVSAIGAILAWLRFARLEAIDGRGPDVGLERPVFFPRAGSRGLRRRHPIVLLAAKELRLQQLAVAVATLYMIGYVGAAAASRLTEAGILTMFYAGLLAVLIGALASAEERSLGTHDWQLLMPMSSTRQWLVKAAVTMSLALVLGVAVPCVLAYALPPRGDHWYVWRYFNGGTTALLAALVSASLYVSSLCRSGLWALLASLPAIFAASAFVGVVARPVAQTLPYSWHIALSRRAVVFTPDHVAFLSVACVVALLLWLGHSNHRTADRDWVRVVAQGVSIAGGLIAFVTMSRVFGF
jgi:hypothetical protein